MLITKNNFSQLLGMDRMKTLKLTFGRMQLAEHNQSEKEEVVNEFLDIFGNNDTVEDNEKTCNLNLYTSQLNKKQEMYHYTYKKISNKN